MWEEERSGNKDSLNRAVTLESLALLDSNLSFAGELLELIADPAEKGGHDAKPKSSVTLQFHHL